MATTHNEWRFSRVTPALAGSTGHPLADAVARTAQHFVYVFDLVRARTTYSNRSVLAELGHAVPDDLPLPLWAAYVHPDDQDRLQSLPLEWAALADDGVREGEWRIRHADGSYHWFQGRDTVLARHPDGGVLQIVGTLLDVTETRRAADASLEREGAAELLRGLLDMSPLPTLVVTVEENHRILSLNSRFTEVFGYTIRDIPDVDTWWPRAYPDPEYRAQVQRAWGDAIAGAEQSGVSAIAPVEAMVTCKDGSQRYVEVHMGLFGDRALVLFSDLTERKRTEEALRESDGFLRMSQQAGGCGSWELNLATGRLKWSDELCRINGISPDQFTGTVEEASRFYHPDDLPRIGAEFQRLRDGHAVRGVRYRIVRPDGTQRVLWGSGETLPGPDGRPQRAIGTVVDLTDQARTEHTLRRVIEAITPVTGPDFFRSLANHLTEACQVDYAHVVMLDQEEPTRGHAIASSCRGHLIEGVSYDVRGTPCEQVIAKGLYHWPTGVQGQFPADAYLVDLGIDSYMGIPLVASSGKALGLIALLHRRPIAEPQQAETILKVVAARVRAELERELTARALRDSEARHRAILESSLDGLIVFAAGGRILEFNGAAEAMFGRSRGEVIGRAVTDVVMPAPLRERHERALAHYLEGRTNGMAGERIEMPALRADGTEFRVEFSLVRIGGTADGLYACVVRDITDRLKLEEQLRQSQKLHAIGQLAGGVAHDFNNLLTVIMGYTDVLLADLDPTHPLFEAASHVHDAGERATLLTRQLLMFGRKAILEPRPLDLNAVLQNTSALLRRLIGEHVTFATVLSPSLGHTRADRSQVEQVIINLCLNSRDAMPQGGRITIETRGALFDEQFCRSHPGHQPGRFVELAVGDTGIGMAPETKAHLFEPFFTTKGLGKGTGLGLATVYGIVQQAGGFITVDSEPGAGTTFHVFFPVVDSADVREAAVALPAPLAPGRETVLLVEDEEGVRGLGRLALEKHGYTVLAAATGAEAVSLAESRRGGIDLLITDVVMPGMNGREVAERLREQQPGLKVLFISGYNDEDVIGRGILHPSSAFLQKPFDLKALARKVAEVIGDAPHPAADSRGAR